MRIRYRGGDVTFHPAEPVHRLHGGIASRLELDDGDQILGALQRDRYCRYPTACDLLDRRLDVLGIVIAPTDDQQVLDATDDEQLALGDETQIAGSQPGSVGRARRRVDQRCPEAALLLRGLRQ